MNQPIRLNEKDDAEIIAQWMADAKLQTSETIGSFCERLIADYTHDCGTIVHAMWAAMVGAMSVVGNSEQGGLTGFRASCLAGLALRMLCRLESGTIINDENLCYPQYESDVKTISEERWEWIQRRAASLLAKGGTMSSHVREHLVSIVAGTPPFGLRVK